MNKRTWAVMAATLILSFSTGTAQESTSRPRAGQKAPERPNVGQEYTPVPNEQRRQETYIYNEKGGDLNPRLNDPAIRTWVDKNGFNIRPVVPQDLRSAIQMQQEVLGELRGSIQREEAANNQKISASKTEFFLARSDEKASLAQKSGLELQKYNAEQRWAISRFNRCPNGESWSSCTHFAEKAAWESDRDAELEPILTGIGVAESRIAAAREKGNRAYAELQSARQAQTVLQDRVENYQGLLQKQKRGEPFLFMPK
jgi:hypothetical protein